MCCFHLLVLISVYSSVLAQMDEFVYNGFKNSINLTLSGSAQIWENGVLRLTNDERRMMGHAFFPNPIRFKKTLNGTAVSFSTTFSFAIVPEYQKLGGHGMAFTISRSRHMRDALPSQYLGLLNANDVGNFSNHLFAVELDTAQDFEFHDINDNHVGIDLNDLKSSAAVPAGYYDGNSIKQGVSLTGGVRIQAWVEYDSSKNIINVTISPDEQKPGRPILSYKVDLSPIVEEFMYVGFSASTGILASSHYLLGWSFKLNGEAESLDFSSLPSIRKRKKHVSFLIGIPVLLVGLVGLISGSIILGLKMKMRDVIEEWEMEITPHRFGYHELKRATGGFRDKGLLGRGGFGRVYKGTLPNSKTQIAVKRVAHDSKQGLKEFAAEINIIGRLRHRNLVQLLGWCRRRSDLLLVYDYMENGSLDRFLFGNSAGVLSWDERVRIIKGVAYGLLYLHEGYEKVVIHRDVKASNVLLDGEMNSRLGDFGLARLHDRGSNLNTTRVVGTLGYLAPEVPRTGKATVVTDVYAFGVVMLEVVCGRRPIETSAATEELVLVDWVYGMWRHGHIVDVVDVRLEGDFVVEEAKFLLKLGLMCSNEAPTARPSMSHVVKCLEGEVGLPGRFALPSSVEGTAGSSFNSFCASPLPLLHCYEVGSCEV